MFSRVLDIAVLGLCAVVVLLPRPDVRVQLVKLCDSVMHL
jgi:hypothetical protein